MIGIYGGTFDPIHNGHLHVIKELLRSKRVDRIILVPAGDPQLRSKPVASGPERLAMCELAVSQLGSLKDSVEVSEIEIERKGPTFAIETVEELMTRFPGKELAWIIGSDAYRKVGDWHESERLQDLVSFIVIERPTESDRRDRSDSDDERDEFDTMEIDALHISATEIRERLRQGGDVSAMVPATVLSYIGSKGLYGSE